MRTLCCIDPPERSHHTHRQLLAAHFHAEDRHRHLLPDGHILGDVHGERGLAHRRAAGDDDQVAGLQAGGHVVQIGEAGGDAGDRRLGTEQRVDAVDRLGQQRLADDARLAGRARSAISNTLRSAASSNSLLLRPSGL